MAKDPSLVSPQALRYTHLPGGHQESWADAFRNLMADAYVWIRAGAVPEAKPDMLPTFEDGYRSTLLVDAMLRSHAAGGVWQPVVSSS
jgi:predicted dehydrogenase